MTMQPEPWNFKLARITPKWAFKQSARRILVLVLAISPFALGVLLSSLPSPFLSPLLLIPVVAFFWLIGATHARADSPDEYLDEREVALRNQVYLQAFRILGAMVSLGFLAFSLFPNLPMTGKDAFTLLFPIAIFLPTCVLAWIAPDPLEEA